MKHTYDKDTEKFRTIRNLRGFDDRERGFPPPAVDDSDYEDINKLVARFMRGEQVNVARKHYYDTVTGGEPVLSPVETDGFDLADTGPLMGGIESRATAPVVPLTPPAGAAETPPVGNPEPPNAA